MGDLNELVERLRAMCVDWNAQPMDDGELPRIEPHCRDLREAATALTSLMAERDHVEALLRGRDTFIVDQGLWTAFVATLPLNPPRTALSPDTNKGDGV